MSGTCLPFLFTLVPVPETPHTACLPANLHSCAYCGAVAATAFLTGPLHAKEDALVPCCFSAYNLRKEPHIEGLA